MKSLLQAKIDRERYEKKDFVSHDRNNERMWWNNSRLFIINGGQSNIMLNNVLREIKIRRMF